MQITTKLLLPALLFWMLAATADRAAAQPAACTGEPTLDEMVECIKDHMPDEDTEGYVLPDAGDLAAWRTAVDAMLGGQCGPAALPSRLQASYTMTPFTDAGKTYCVLVETTDADSNDVVDLGWGTFVFNPAPDARPLSMDVPHPLNDTDTPEEGIAVFKGTNARTFLMAGAHREANHAVSPCDDDYHVADAAHNADHPFHAAIEAMDAFDQARGQAFMSVQFHGMGTSSCPGVDVYITHGSKRPPLPNSLADQLKRNFGGAVPAAWDWTVTVPGDAPDCNKTGTGNVQGRLLNGVAAGAVCTARNYNYTGRFIHIEQKRYVRSDSVYSYWIDAFNALDYSIVPPPPGYWLTTPNGGERWVAGKPATITWTSQNITDPVHLALFRDGDYDRRITKSTQNDGSFTWNVPSTLAQDVTYTIRIMSTVDDDIRDYSDAAFGVMRLTTTAQPGSAHAERPAAMLLQNSPNPFNPATTIRFTLPAETHVRLKVYDLLGREVATLVDGLRAAGAHDVRFDGAHLATGMYLYRIEAGDAVETRPMLLMK